MNYNNEKQRTYKGIETKIDYPIIKSKKEGTLYLSSELKTQIDTFHSFAGSTEWSGVLLYTIDKGDIFDPAKLKIKAKGMFPMDIGSPGYTEYDYDENTLDMYDFYPNALKEEWRLGHIHSHHNMRAFFSGTDLQELRDNIDNHAYYLSLIVNFDGEYCAKICVKGSRTVKEDSILEYKGLLSDESTVHRHKQEREESIVYTVDLNIEIPEVETEPSFIKELLKLKKRQNEKKVTSNTYNKDWYGRKTGSVHPDYTRNQLDLWGDSNSKDKEYEQDVKQFLVKLLRVEPSNSGIRVEETVKKYTKKYNDMTMTDKDLYMGYMADNVNAILEVMDISSKIKSNRPTSQEVIEDSITMLEEWTSSTYGYSSYERCHFVDEVCNMLCEYGIENTDEESGYSNYYNIN